MAKRRKAKTIEDKKAEIVGRKDEKFRDMCLWIETELLGYDGIDQKIQKAGALALIGLQRGQAVANNNCEQYGSYPIDIIFATFKINKFVIKNAIKNKKFDGMIITGAPVEQIPFEEVDYWPELCEIMDWAKAHVTSTFHICWGAQAGLYYHYGLKKVLLPKKLFGVYHHKVMNRKNPLVRGFDDYFLIPHSRHTAVLSEDIHQCKELTVLAESEEAGVLLCMSEGGKEIYVMGHPEYDRYTLHKEYVRDKEKGLPIDVPKNYYPEDDDTQKPCLEWRAHCNILYSNWLNYFVYQITPYEL